MEEQKRVQKNYTIEFFRLIFTIIICIYHIQSILSKEYIPGAYIGVEFFFILSGFYLYKSAEKNKKDTSIDYTLKRIKRILPYYIFSMVTLYGVDILTKLQNNQLDKVATLFIPLSEIFMIQNIGFFRGALNSPTWYISVLVIGGHIIYDIIKRKKDLFIKLIGPIIIIYSYGVLRWNSSYIENWGINYGLYVPLLRGMADMTIGCLIAFFTGEYKQQISQFIDNHRITYVFFEIWTYVGIAYLIFNKTEYDIYCLILFSILIIMANNEKSISTKLFNNKIFKRSGELTLTIYLSHMVVVRVVSFMYKKILNRYIGDIEIILIYLIMAVIYAIIINLIIKKINNKALKYKNT